MDDTASSKRYRTCMHSLCSKRDVISTFDICKRSDKLLRLGEREYSWCHKGQEGIELKGKSTEMSMQKGRKEETHLPHQGYSEQESQLKI